jgi:predicted transcriptional regulator
MATAAQARELLKSLKKDEVTVTQAVQDLKEAGAAPKDAQSTSTPKKTAPNKE